MRVFMLTAYPAIAGPLPKLAPLMVDEMRRLGCQVSTEPWSHRRESESLLAKVTGRALDLRQIRRRLNQQRFDVMLVTTTHDWPALLRDIPLLALTRGACRARVLHFHGSMVDELRRPGRRVFKWCSSWLVRRCDAVLVLSREEQLRWRAFSPGTRFEVVVNPFEPSGRALNSVARGSRDRPALLFVGRLIPEKGVFDLLEAVRSISTNQDCLLRIAGQGSHERAIRERVSDLGLSDRVELAGYVEGDALEQLYLSSDVFVLPTYFGEGFPTVLTEAMSYGLPIVTTPVRGAVDHLSEVLNTLFVPPRQPELLARALRRLLNDSALRTDMGMRNREKVKSFAPSVVVPQYVDIMNSLVGGDSRNDGSNA
jgi:glycosyltransferase involved in cell wall biosynthesis